MKHMTIFNRLSVQFLAYGQTGGCLFPGIFHGCPRNVIFDRANAHGFPSRRRAIPQIAASRPRSDRQYRVRRWCKLLDLAPHPRGSGLVFQFLLMPFNISLEVLTRSTKVTTSLLPRFGALRNVCVV